MKNRYKEVKKASMLGILGNILLFCLKVIAGFVSHSYAMIADAFNSGSDILSSLITFIGNNIASKPEDECHNLGHGKAEYIYAMFISMIMIIGAFIVSYNSFMSFIISNKYHFSIYLIIVCVITILVKLALYIYTRNISKKQHNLLLEANSKDHRNDMLITLLNLIACYFSYQGIYFVDGLFGIIISLWIIYTGIIIFKQSYDVLMDKAISLENKNKVLEIIKNYPDIKKINHFNSTPVGYKYQISITIFVDGNLSTFESHKIADNLEKEIVSKIEDIYLAIIHVNPLDINK